MSRSSEVAALRILFRHVGEWVELGKLFGPNATVTEAKALLSSYTEAGYSIEVGPAGARLLSPGDVWCAEEILARVEEGKSGIILDPVVLAVTHSTNDVARDAALRGTPEGLVVVASEQTAGRGRAGRTWHSPPQEGLYVSLLLRPTGEARCVGRLGITVGVAVADAIEVVSGIRPDLKWPNDLLMQNQKLGGILIETELAGNMIDFAVIGIGINVRSQVLPEELKDRATSIYLKTGVLYRRIDVLLALLASLERRLQEDFTQSRKDWEAGCPSVGHRIELRTNGSACAGIMVGLDASGALLLKTDSGENRTVYGGEVSQVTRRQVR